MTNLLKEQERGADSVVLGRAQIVVGEGSDHVAVTNLV